MSVESIDYRQYEGNKSGFLSALLSKDFISYVQEVGVLGKFAQDHKTGMFSIEDLMSIPGVSALPSVQYFQNIDRGNVDLAEVKFNLQKLEQDLKNNYGDSPIEYNDSVIKFYGEYGLDVSDLSGKQKTSFNSTVENNVNFANQIDATLSEEAITSFGIQTPEQSFLYNEENQVAGVSNVLTLGGNYYDANGVYVTREGEHVMGTNGNPVEAPYKKDDGWNLFWQRDDLFEVQQLIVEAGGPAPETLGVWDKNLSKYMNNVLAYANDSRSWEVDMESGLSMENQWRSALNEYKLQNESGTQLSEILTTLGYSTVNKPKPTASEAKAKVDSLYGELGLKATARDYKDIGEAFMELSTQAEARQAEIDRKAVGLKDLLLGTTKFVSSPPSPETPEGIEYQKAVNEGRVLETSTGIYIVPCAESLAESKQVPEAIDVDGKLREMVESRDATRIQGVQDRDFQRDNATLFKSNFLTAAKTGLG
jgi:hypothetical protein